MKRMLVLLLAVLIITTSAPALASSVPSKTTQDLAQVVSSTADDGTALPDNFLVEMPEGNESVDKVLKMLIDLVVGQGLAPVHFFDETVQEAIQLLVPEGTDLDKFTIEEFSPLSVENYEQGYGNITATFSFATQYQDGQVLVALIGIVTGEDEQGNPLIEWTPIKAEVEGGLVKVHFPEELLQRIDGQDAIITILSDQQAA